MRLKKRFSWQCGGWIAPSYIHSRLPKVSHSPAKEKREVLGSSPPSPRRTTSSGLRQVLLPPLPFSSPLPPPPSISSPLADKKVPLGDCILLCPLLPLLYPCVPFFVGCLGKGSDNSQRSETPSSSSHYVRTRGGSPRKQQPRSLCSTCECTVHTGKTRKRASPASPPTTSAATIGKCFCFWSAAANGARK